MALKYPRASIVIAGLILYAFRGEGVSLLQQLIFTTTITNVIHLSTNQICTFGSFTSPQSALNEAALKAWKVRSKISENQQQESGPPDERRQDDTTNSDGHADSQQQQQQQAEDTITAKQKSGNPKRITLLGLDDILQLERSGIVGLGSHNVDNQNHNNNKRDRLNYKELHNKDMIEDGFYDPFAADPSCFDDRTNDDEDEDGEGTKSTNVIGVNCWHPPDSTVETEYIQVWEDDDEDGDDEASNAAGLETLAWGYGGDDPDDSLLEEDDEDDDDKDVHDHQRNGVENQQQESGPPDERRQDDTTNSDGHADSQQVIQHRLIHRMEQAYCIFHFNPPTLQQNLLSLHCIRFQREVAPQHRILMLRTTTTDRYVGMSSTIEPGSLSIDYGAAHDEHPLLQERMRHPIAFLAEMVGDIMYYHQAIKLSDAPEFVEAIVKEVNGHVDNNSWVLIRRDEVPPGERGCSCCLEHEIQA